MQDLHHQPYGLIYKSSYPTHNPTIIPKLLGSNPLGASEQVRALALSAWFWDLNSLYGGG